MKYICDVCGWEYDETTGDPEHGIAPGTKFADLPDDFECPLCGVGKDQFSAEQTLLKEQTGRQRKIFSFVCRFSFLPEAVQAKSIRLF